jgi:hypothetical protein
MKDHPGLDVHHSSFTGKAFKLAMPRIVLFDALSTREIMLAIPAEKLVLFNVTNLLGVVRAAKREKYFEYLLVAVARDIGPDTAKKLALIIKKTNKAFGRAPVTRLLFLARVAVAHKFDCDVCSSVMLGPTRCKLEEDLIPTIQAAIDQLVVSVQKKTTEI